MASDFQWQIMMVQSWSYPTAVNVAPSTGINAGSGICNGMYEMIYG